MSWNLQVEVASLSDVHEAVKEAGEKFFANNPGMNDARDEATEQIAAASDAVQTLLEHIGTDGPWLVTLNGHANEDHGKRKGWSNETITVSIIEQGMP